MAGNDRGSIEAYLRLDISNFEKNTQKAASDFQKTFGKGLTSQLSSAVPGVALQNANAQLQQAARNTLSLRNQLQTLGIPVSTFNRILNESKSSFAAMGNQVPSLSRQIATALLPGDAIMRGVTQQFLSGTKSLMTMNDQARITNGLYSQLSSGALSAGRAAVRAYPIEHISQASAAQAAFNRNILTTSSSYAATGRSFLAAESVMSGGWARVGSAAGKASSIIGTIGTKINAATQALDNFGTGLLGVVGVMASQQFYDFTVGMANTFQGYEQFWNKAYGTQTGSLYAQVVEQMQSQYYAQPATTAKTLQLLANTMPTTTSSTDIAQLTPYVQAYINFYKKMKPEFASLAEIEGPQDIAAVFSGNTGEIRASPLAQPLKDIAAMPDEKKLAALKQLFESRGIMEFTSGLTQYDKEMNKFNSTMNELGINVGTKLLPYFTSLMIALNNFIKNNQGLSEFVIIAGGVVIALAAIGGIGGMALQALQSGWVIVAGLGREFGTLTARVLAAAGANVVLKDSSVAMTATNVQWGATLRNIGASLVSFLISPLGIAVIAVTALVATIVILGSKYGWFTSAVTKAGNEMNRLNTQVDTAKKKQEEAQQKVTDLTNKLSQQAAGTPEWIKTKYALAQAEIDLKTATTNVTTAQQNSTTYQAQLAEAQNRLAESYKSVYRAYIAYQVATGQMDPAVAQSRLNAVDQITQGNYAYIDSIHQQAFANENTAKKTADLTDKVNLFKDSIIKIPGAIGQLWSPFDRLNLYMSTLFSGTDGSGKPTFDLDKFNPLKVFFPGEGSMHGLIPNNLFPSIQTPNSKGLDVFNPVSAADGGKGKPSFGEDVKQLFDFSRFGIKWPSININSFISPIRRLPNTVKTIFRTTIQSAGSIVTSGVHNISGFFGRLPGSVTGALGGFWGAVTNPITGTLNYARNFVGGTISNIGSIFWGLVGNARGAWNSIRDAVSNPVQTIINIINRLRSALGMGAVAGGDITGTSSGLNQLTSGTLDLPIEDENLRNKVMSSLYSDNFAGGCEGGLCGLFAGGDSGSSWTNVGGWKNLIINRAKSMAAGFLNKFGLGDLDLSNPASAMTGAFLATANKIFSAFHYEFYFNSRYGVLGTLMNRGGNCYDMTSLLLSLAHGFGLNGYMVPTTWNGIGHVRAFIQGIGDMDPTGFVQRGGWKSYPSAGGDGMGGSEVHFHITNKFEKEVFGIDEFDQRVKDKSKEGTLEVLNKYFKPNSFG